ncbi:unnamed protein product, partial [Ectocarpus sp. 12 AP-2014]
AVSSSGSFFIQQHNRRHGLHTHTGHCCAWSKTHLTSAVAKEGILFRFGFFHDNLHANACVWPCPTSPFSRRTNPLAGGRKIAYRDEAWELYPQPKLLFIKRFRL